MKDMRVTPDRLIFIKNDHIGYVDEKDDVYVFQNSVAVRIGSIDHPTEIVTLIEEWIANGRHMAGA